MKILVMSLVVICNNRIQFDNKNLNFIEKLQYALRNDDDAVIFPDGSSSDYTLANNPGKVTQRHTESSVVRLAFLLRFF